MAKVLPLVCLALAIGLGFWKKMNTGLVAIALAFLAGRVGGMTDGQILAGMNSSLFVTLAGVTYLFSIASVNGTMELAARKALGLLGKRMRLVPIVIFVLCALLSAVGPGSISVMALAAPFAMAISARTDISPTLLAPMVVLGACGAGVSPIAPTGIIGITCAQEAGYIGIEGPFFVSSMVSLTLWATVLYFALGGHRLGGAFHDDDHPGPFNREQRITLIGIGAMVVLVLGFRANVGLAAFLVSLVLILLRVADERSAIAAVPWGTLMLVTGVGMLMGVAKYLGSVELLSDFLGRMMTPKTAVLSTGLLGGTMSWFSSTSAVVMPTLTPTVPHLVAKVGGAVSPLTLISAITNCSHAGATSPLSTGGALALAAYMANKEGDAQKLFLSLFAVSAAGVAFVAVLGSLGLYDWIARLL